MSSTHCVALYIRSKWEVTDIHLQMEKATEQDLLAHGILSRVGQPNYGKDHRVARPKNSQNPGLRQF